jgi:RNA polymerase sigma factor (sigma-70 family)
MIGTGLASKRLDLNVTDCLARVLEHDEEAARLLVEHLYPTVIRIVRKNLPRRRATEEDLAQEIFVKVFAKLKQYRGEVPLEHWVARVAVNHCLNALRSQSIRPEWRMADLSEEQENAICAAASANTQEPDPAHIVGAREIVTMMLDSLSPEDRLVIQMLEIEERSVEEICEATGWSSTLVRVRAFRARRKLNKRFSHLKKEARL